VVPIILTDLEPVGQGRQKHFKPSVWKQN